MLTTLTITAYPHTQDASGRKKNDLQRRRIIAQYPSFNMLIIGLIILYLFFVAFLLPGRYFF